MVLVLIHPRHLGLSLGPDGLLSAGLSDLGGRLGDAQSHGVRDGGTHTSL